jgi:hypothetical protein
MVDDERGAWLFTAATWLAVASIALVLVNGALALRGQGEQLQVNQRQQTINQSAQLARVSQILVETVAKSAVANKDDTLTQLLERHGVTINVKPQSAAPAGDKP